MSYVYFKFVIKTLYPFLLLLLFSYQSLGQKEILEGLHSEKQLTLAQQKVAQGNSPVSEAYEALLEQAGLNRNRNTAAIENFNVPGYYEDANGHRAAMKALSNDAWIAYSCALAYRLSSGDERDKFAQKAISVLMAWSNTNKKTSNYDGDLAMTDAGVGLIFAAELMLECENWSAFDKAIFTAWVKSVYLKSAEKIAEAENNWGDWGTLGCMASYSFLNDKNALIRYTEKLRIRIDKTIATDGSMPHEIKRGKRGLWYTYFSLAPLSASCQIAYNALGVNLFEYKGSDGAGIEEALDYLLRYTINPKAYPHHNANDLMIGKPSLYPGNLFEAMYGIFGKKEYLDYALNGRPIMVYGHHYAWAVPTLLPPSLKSKK